MFEELKKLGCEGCGGGAPEEPVTDENCTHNCSSCPSAGGCGSFDPKSLIEETNEHNSIKKVIAVVSGKGGVGKSLVTSMMAVTMRRRGFNVGIMDADVTGPSIPKAFGVTESAGAVEEGIVPLYTSTGIASMSVNNLLEDATDPVLWRGPVIAGLVKQFWTDVLWGDIDYLFVDMPPGTGDVALTVYQSLPVDGIVIVTSPQELVGMIVEKAVKMAEMMNIPVSAIVENMSYFKCPDCGKEHKIFGESNIEDIAGRYGIQAVAKLPINPEIAQACDNGSIEDIQCEELADLAKLL